MCEEREGVKLSCLVYKVPSIIGGGSFVQQRGQTVVGLSPISLFSLMREKKYGKARKGFIKKKNGKEVALASGKGFCGLCGLHDDDGTCPISYSG